MLELILKLLNEAVAERDELRKKLEEANDPTFATDEEDKEGNG